MMKKTMKKAMVAMMAALALTGAVASTSTVFACDEEFSSEADYECTIAAVVRVSKGYLALRTAPCYSEDNEIGELYTGDCVIVQYNTGNGYAYVYSPKHRAYGFVNTKYLID